MKRRFYEAIPGALAWATLILIVFFSWRLPTAISIFIILFDLYWLFKTVYLSFHLRATFRTLRENLKIDWLAELSNGDWRIANREGKRVEQIPDWQGIFHLVILPMFREPYEVVRESFESLAAARYPKEKMIVVLATEERAGEAARETALRIEREFGGKFFKFLVTAHPGNLPGEVPGKGSNETWAAEEARQRILDPLGFDKGKVLVSVFDADTRAYPDYFARLTYVFLASENRMRAIYQPIPLFTNNIFEAPALARVVSLSATFWQMMQQSRPERLTSFSSQAIPFLTIEEMGFWHKDIVSEDSRVFWQGYLHYHGDFRVYPLMYPVSMDANVAPTFWATLKNIYRQQRRWAWGAENIPYMLDGFDKDRAIPKSKKRYWAWNAIEGFHSWATNSIMIFALGWLPVALGGRHFNYSMLSYSLPQVTRFIVTLSMIGIASSAVLTILLLPPKPKWFSLKHTIYYVIQWALVPITLIVFGAIPALDAETRLMLGGRFKLGFWVTPKIRKNAALAQKSAQIAIAVPEKSAASANNKKAA